MSRKNRKTRTTATSVGDDRYLHAVADQHNQQAEPTTEDKVHAALAATPGSTTAKLAMAAGVGRSTAAKILARWDHDGTAIRTAGDGPRNPDTWTLASPDSDTAATDTNDSQPDTTATPSTDTPTDHASGTTAKDTAEAAVPDVDDAAAEDTAATQGPEAGSGTDDTNAVPDTTEDMAPVEGATEPEPSSAPSGKDRLPKGGLRGLVEDYLTDHPDESFGPAKIGKDLRRSGGAVNNALEKLVVDGYAIKTCEAPKRFAIAPDKTDVPATAASTE